MENKKPKKQLLLIRENDRVVYRKRLIAFQHYSPYFNEYMF